MVPELVEVFAQALDTRGAHGIQPPVANRLVFNEVSVLEHAEVLRDGRTADGKLAGRFAYRERAVKQSFEDGPAGGISQRGQLGVHGRVGKYSLTVRLFLPTIRVNIPS